MRAAPVGERNSRLNQAAFSLGMLAAGGKLDEGLVEDEFLAAAADVGLGELEAKASIHSGLRPGTAPVAGDASPDLRDEKPIDDQSPCPLAPQPASAVPVSVTQRCRRRVPSLIWWQG